MTHMPRPLWIAACAHRLQEHWHTVDPLELEAVAGEIYVDPRLRDLAPAVAAAEWLRPVEEGIRASR